MSVRIAGSDKRLTLQLPAEGQGWARQGDEMIPVDLGGGGSGPFYERVDAEGPISPTITHTDLVLDGIGDVTYTLAAGTTDGFRKTIRVYEAAGAASHITGAFRTGNFAQTNLASLDVQADGNVPDEISLIWNAALAKWVIVMLNVHLSGPP